jgi:hypothetical protein
MRMCEEVLKSQSHEPDTYVRKLSLGIPKPGGGQKGVDFSCSNPFSGVAFFY